MNYNIYDLPIGATIIAEECNFITKITVAVSSEMWKREGNRIETHIIKQTVKQLKEYLSGKRRIFDLPLNPKGTEFQNKVWNALLTIPYGETRSYKQIAEQTGNPKAARAVGMANNKNPIAIVIPCHRVIGAGGSMVGYGLGLPMKEMLLKLEKKEPM